MIEELIRRRKWESGADIPLRLAALAASPLRFAKGERWLELVAVFVVGEA